jgi:hypothetical protein
MKRTIPLLIASTTGFVLIAAFFVPPAKPLTQLVEKWFTILSAVAFLTAGASLLLHHLKKISAQQSGWGYSAVTVVAFLVTIGVGLLKVGVPVSPQFPDHPWAGSYQEEGSALWWLYEYVFFPIIATLFALLAFYVASAAFRAFRAKNTEAVLLLATAFLILLGRQAGEAQGDTLTVWSMFQTTMSVSSTTVKDVVMQAGQRAIMIGIALGVAATSLRILLGLDRSYLGAD